MQRAEEAAFLGPNAAGLKASEMEAEAAKINGIVNFICFLFEIDFMLNVMHEIVLKDTFVSMRTRSEYFFLNKSHRMRAALNTPTKFLLKCG